MRNKISILFTFQYIIFRINSDTVLYLSSSFWGVNWTSELLLLINAVFKTLPVLQACLCFCGPGTKGWQSLLRQDLACWFQGGVVQQKCMPSAWECTAAPEGTNILVDPLCSLEVAQRSTQHQDHSYSGPVFLRAAFLIYVIYCGRSSRMWPGSTVYPSDQHVDAASLLVIWQPHIDNSPLFHLLFTKR